MFKETGVERATPATAAVGDAAAGAGVDVAGVDVAVALFADFGAVSVCLLDTLGAASG
jgi:hypothetical protein